MPEQSPTAAAETLPFPDQIIRRVMVAYPNQAPKIFADDVLGNEAWRFWREELREMAKRFGEQRVEASLTRWIRANEYMPEISQLRDGIQPEANPRGNFDPACADCQGTGFKRDLQGKYERCACFKRWGRRRPAK